MQTLIINVIVLAVMLLLFEATPKSDDHDMVKIVYGGYTGEITPYMLYSNIILGRVIAGLLTVFPTVSWYYVLQYMGIFASLTTMTYIFSKKCNDNRWFIPTVCMLAFCGYEFYVRITFSKTSGLLIATGFLWFLYLIERGDFFCIKYTLGIGLILFGALIRNGSGIYLLICEVFFASFIIYLIKNRNFKSCIKGVIGFVVLVAGLYGCISFLYTYNRAEFSKDENWNDFFEISGARAALADYGWPSYEKYSEEYQRLGVSENDIRMWKNYTVINDAEVLDVEQLKAIREIAPIQEETTLRERMAQIAKNMLPYYLNDTGFYLYIFAVITLVYYRNDKNRKWIILFPTICCLVAYFYMSIQGRLQHHVDVTVLVTGAMLLLYYAFSEIRNSAIRKDYMLAISVMGILFVNKFYLSLTNSCYYSNEFGEVQSQSEWYAKNKETLSLLSDDTEHMYLFTAHTTNWIYDAAWNIREVMEPGFYHNMYITNHYGIPDEEQVLENYQIENVYKELINSDRQYLVLNEVTKQQIDYFNQYLQEHYGENTYYILAKRVDDLYIYRFLEGEVQPKWSDKAWYNGENVTSDISVVMNEDGSCYVNGYAFVDGFDSYSQNICIEMRDLSSGDRKYTYATQYENSVYSNTDKYKGKYSWFDVSISEEMMSEDICITVYVEMADRVYEIPIQFEQ